MAEWFNALVEKNRDGLGSVGVLLGAGKFGNTGGNINQSTRAEINSISVGYAHL